MKRTLIHYAGRFFFVLAVVLGDAMFLGWTLMGWGGPVRVGVGIAVTASTVLAAFVLVYADYLHGQGCLICDARVR